MASKEDQKQYEATLMRSERVVAALPLQEHLLPLSNLDLLLPPVHFGVILCYEKPVSFDALKASLARTLVSYYVLSGDVVVDARSNVELLCNNRGVDFVEAYADVELRELCFYNPDECVDGKLAPTVKEGVLCVQATELKCGGVVLTCMFDHRVVDAYSANNFLLAWAAATSTSASISIAPSFRHSLLTPRRPSSFDTSIDRLYVPLASLPPPPQDSFADRSISRIYAVSSTTIQSIQTSASAGGHKRTKLESFVAYLWRLIGRCAQGAGACKMGIVVDGRTRLSSSGEMANYFGNVLSLPFGSLCADELKEMEMWEVAKEVHEIVRATATEEHFRDLVDWVEALRRKPALARVYCEDEGEKAGPAVVVSSGLKFPVREMDFGWGRPVFGSYHFPWGATSGYVMPMPSAGGREDWVVYAHLPHRLIQALEDEDGGRVFHRLSRTHLGLAGDKVAAAEPLVGN